MKLLLMVLLIVIKIQKGIILFLLYQNISHVILHAKNVISLEQKKIILVEVVILEILILLKRMKMTIILIVIQIVLLIFILMNILIIHA